MEPVIHGKILEALALKRWQTQYDLYLWLKKEVSLSRIHEGVRDLESVRMVVWREAGMAPSGLIKKEYSLTFWGLVAAVTLSGECWEKIDEVARNYPDLLPLVFGKWNLFKEIGIPAIVALRSAFLGIYCGLDLHENSPLYIFTPSLLNLPITQEALLGSIRPIEEVIKGLNPPPIGRIIQRLKKSRLFLQNEGEVGKFVTKIILKFLLIFDPEKTGKVLTKDQELRELVREIKGEEERSLSKHLSLWKKVKL
ncbi:MAG: hypothetical protein QXR87_05490 [Candidatus Hadarchaeales archaeon]